MVRRFLLVVVISLMPFASRVHADGLVYRLPEDGAWVRYTLSGKGHWTITFPEDVKVPPGLKNAQNFPAKSTGSLVLRSVGQRDLDGERCRWIELESSVEIVGKFPGRLQEQTESRHIILKMLIPEKHLAPGADPLAHVKNLYFKDGEREPELVEDAKAKQYELDRFRPIFPAPAQQVDKSQKQRRGGWGRSGVFGAKPPAGLFKVRPSRSAGGKAKRLDPSHPAARGWVIMTVAGHDRRPRTCNPSIAEYPALQRSRTRKRRSQETCRKLDGHGYPGPDHLHSRGDVG